MSIKNNQKYRINHQTQNDLTGEWFEFDKKFKAKRFTSFIYFKVNFAGQTSSNWFVFNLKQLQIKSLQFNEFMSNNIITILTTILVILGLGGATAQAFAPEEYKPSTIIQKTFNPKDFASNTVAEKNPYTPLRPDAQNDVIFSDVCDLAIKYPKRYENKFNTVVYRNSTFTNPSDPKSDYLFVFPVEGELTSGDEYMGPSISCGEQVPYGLDPDPTYAGVVDTAAQGKEIKNVGIDFIKKETGWFLTQAEISGVRAYDNPNIPGDYKVYFKYKNLHYLIEFQTDNLKNVEGDSDGLVKVIKASAIQIQFKSLVESQANAQILDQKGLPVSEKQQNTSKTAIIAEAKNPSLERLVNDRALVTNGYGEDGLCGILGVVDYSFPAESGSGYMHVTSSKLDFDENQRKSFNRLSDLLNGKTSYSPDFANQISYIDQFSSACSGFAAYEKFIEAPQIAYPKTDKVKIIYSLAGQAEILNPTVLIFASKGDNQIWIEGPISEIQYPLLPLAESCGFSSADPKVTFDKACYENKMKNDPKLKIILDQTAKDLIKDFELK
jgi:hypothetical protein